MLTTNDRGTYPSVMIHHSNYSQLSIGGAMINRFHKDEGEAECCQCTPTGCSGWHTRFDGGNRPGVLDVPCDLVAMYVEGQINITGFEGAYDSDVVVEPQCYAVAVFRSKEEKDFRGKVIREAKEEYVYLRSGFNFVDRIRHDGVYDLKNAFETARNSGPIESFEDRINRHREYGWQLSEREWHIVGKCRVPGRIRQILHRTINSVKETVDSNFGQGSKFFKLRSKKK